MRLRAIAIFLVFLSAVIAASLWQVDRAYEVDQNAQNEISTRNQLAALVPAVQTMLADLLAHTRATTNASIDRNVSEFSDSISDRIEMVAKIKPSDDGPWTIEGKAFHERTPVRSWADNYTTIALKSAPANKIPERGVALLALMDPQSKPFFLCIFHDVGNRWYAVITKPAVFQFLMDRQKGLFGSVMLLNQQGQVVGHTVTEYVGTSMAEDTLVQDLMKSERRLGSGTFKDLSGASYFGLFENVPTTNIFVVLNRPLAASLKARATLRWQLLLTGIGLLFVGMATLILSLRGPRGSGISSVMALKTDNPQSASQPTKLDEVEARRSELVQERMRAYATSSAAVARELNGPLARILALARLGKVKGNPSASTEMNEIEDLARRSREVVTKLLRFAGEEPYRMEPVGVLECVHRALAIAEAKLTAKGIKVEKNLQRAEMVNANAMALIQALEAIFQNSIEGMERMSTKVLTVELSEEGSSAILKISDTGEGIEPAISEKVFDPFYTTKNRALHSGLGLALASSVVREFGGEIEVQSAVGKGTTVVLRLPLVNSEPVVGPSGENFDGTSETTEVLHKDVAEKRTPAPKRPVPSVLADRAIKETMDVLDGRDLGDALTAKISRPVGPENDDNALEVGRLEDFVEKKLTGGLPPAGVAASPPSAGVAPSPPPPRVAPPPAGANSKIDRPHLAVQGRKTSLAKISVRKPGEKASDAMNADFSDSGVTKTRTTFTNTNRLSRQGRDGNRGES